jgi:hypothetical protein
MVLFALFPRYFRNLDIDLNISKMEQNNFKCKETNFKIAEICGNSAEIMWKVPFQKKKIIELNSMSK